MAPEEEEKPKRRRRRSKPAEQEDTSTSSGKRASGGDQEAPASDATPSEADLSSTAEPDEVEPAAADVEAEAATEVVLEADDEAEEEPEAGAEEPEAEEEPKKPARRRRRRAAAEPAAEKKPAPSRRRRPQRDPSLPPPVVRAKAKYVRASARKARLVCDHIRGKSVEEARAILAHTPRAVARDWSRLLESAVANAEHNHELVGEDLYVKAVHADDGPTIKRFRPRAMGRATRIRKRTSHLTILLTPKD